MTADTASDGLVTHGRQGQQGTLQSVRYRRGGRPVSGQVASLNGF